MNEQVLKLKAHLSTISIMLILVLAFVELFIFDRGYVFLIILLSLWLTMLYSMIYCFVKEFFGDD